MTLPNIVARMQPTGRANARPMINSAKSGNERDACPGLRFAASGLAADSKTGSSDLPVVESYF
jgi:hypothetical protein